jgi:hypothetical protein
MAASLADLWDSSGKMLAVSRVDSWVVSRVDQLDL